MTSGAKVMKYFIANKRILLSWVILWRSDSLEVYAMGPKDQDHRLWVGSMLPAPQHEFVPFFANGVIHCSLEINEASAMKLLRCITA